jgi:hypothetical protein
LGQSEESETGDGERNAAEHWEKSQELRHHELQIHLNLAEEPQNLPMKPKTIPNFSASLFAQLLSSASTTSTKSKPEILFYQSHHLRDTKQNVCERQQS